MRDGGVLKTLDFEFPPENICGRTERLWWIAAHPRPGDVIVELGCGTGYMIARPLLHAGFSVTSVDLDGPSIVLGREIFREEGLNPERLQQIDLAHLAPAPDVVIASDVLEHVPDDELPQLPGTIHRKINLGGPCS